MCKKYRRIAKKKHNINRIYYYKSGLDAVPPF
jgi:hypothetical protein